MSKIAATIEWDRGEIDFRDNRYSRKHHWHFDGGTTVIASSSPDIVPVPMSDPSAVDPEEAFVASLSSCHMLWLLAIAAKKGFVVDRYLDNAEGELAPNASGKLVVATVTLRPKIRWSSEAPSEQELAQMHETAHDECFIANSVKTAVRVEPISNLL